MKRDGDWVQTYTGKQFWPLDPRPEDFDMRDIAHALALKCRFNGHCREFYSVAQHSVLVADRCLDLWPKRFDIAWAGLLHDLEEAYLPDIPRPLKGMGTGILEKSAYLIMTQAAIRYNINLGVMEQVHDVDTEILATEALQLMAPAPAPWNLPQRAITNFKITPASPERAEMLFMEAAMRIRRY